MGTTATAGICDIFDATHGGERFWENTDGDRGVEAERNGTFPPLVVSNFVGKYILSGKGRKKTTTLPSCLFPFDVVFVSGLVTFITHFFVVERPCGLHFLRRNGPGKCEHRVKIQMSVHLSAAAAQSSGLI